MSVGRAPTQERRAMASRETSERPCTPACALGNWPSCQYWAWGLEGADLRTETPCDFKVASSVTVQQLLRVGGERS